MKKKVIIAIVIILVVLGMFAAGIGLLISQFDKSVSISDNSVLEVNLSGPLPDMVQPTLGKDPLTMKDYWYHLKRAKTDDRIQAVVLKFNGIGSGFAKADEFGDIITDFKKSGKKVYAYIENGGIVDYYIATFADEILVYKANHLFLTGLAAESMFMKNTLNKLGVEADILHIGEYKTAMHMFTKDHMTDAHRESLQVLLDDIYGNVMKKIAQNRKLDENTVRQIFDNTPINNNEYLKAKLIDKTIYEDEILKDKDYEWVKFKKYRESKSDSPFEGDEDIAVIFASGEIHNGKSGGESMFSGAVMGSDTVAAYLREARKDKNIKAVVLRVDSPGGSATASEEMRREAELLAKEKPLVVSMSHVAASGGYWISMSAHKVVAQPNTITGSIGVIMGKFVLKGLYENIGVSKEILKTSKYSDIFTDYRKWDDDERAKMMGATTQFYDEFLELVSNNRKMSKDDVDKLARGRIWTGSHALELKLVDQLGGLDTAIAEAKKLAKIDTDTGLVIFPIKKTPFQIIMDMMQGNEQAQANDPVGMLEAKVRMYDDFFPAAMMPYQVKIK